MEHVRVDKSVSVVLFPTILLSPACLENWMRVSGLLTCHTLLYLLYLQALQSLVRVLMLKYSLLLPAQALYILVQRAGVDIQSCLNTLQLLAKQASVHPVMPQHIACAHA